jgi:hypothetical protein
MSAQAQPQESELDRILKQYAAAIMEVSGNFKDVGPKLSLDKTRVAVQALLAAEYTRGAREDRRELLKDIIAWTNLGTMTKEMIREMAEARLEQLTKEPK